MAAYNVVSFNLAGSATGAEPRQIAQTQGKRVASVSCLDLPTGSDVAVRIGSQNADRIQLAVNRTIEICPEEENGIFLDQPTALVGTLILLLSYADGKVLVTNL